MCYIHLVEIKKKHILRSTFSTPKKSKIVGGKKKNGKKTSDTVQGRSTNKDINVWLRASTFLNFVLQFSSDVVQCKKSILRSQWEEENPEENQSSQLNFALT